MGYFAYAYILEAEEDDFRLSMRRSIYEADLNSNGGRALFSWDRGERPDGMFEYAGGSLFSSQELKLLPGYPLTQHLSYDDDYRIEEGFWPQGDNDPVLYHLLLPPRFVPRPDRNLLQPSAPNVAQWGNRLVVSYGVRGGANIRFSIGRIAEQDSFGNYDLDRVLVASKSTSAKVEVEVNLGLLKLKFAGSDPK
jgi:hypothetical protein